jgi:hypothetical protein
VAFCLVYTHHMAFGENCSACDSYLLHYNNSLITLAPFNPPFSLIAIVLMNTAFAGARQYCLEDTFEAKCQENQIVVIDYAKYGRMELGRCVERDYGYIGCATNVTRTLAAKCSGRQECTVVNFEALFAKQHQCATDLKSYLDAEYSCVNGMDRTKTCRRITCFYRLQSRRVRSKCVSSKAKSG